MNFITTLASTLIAPLLFVGATIGNLIVPEQEPTLGASEAIPTTIAFFETTLANAISETATSFTLTSATDKDGTTLASSTYAFVIDEGSANEEIVIADCTGTACINAERGVSVRTGDTEVSTLQKSHRRGASVKMTDAPLLPLVARILRGEGTVDFTPSQGGNLVTKDYVDSLALGSTTVSATLLDDGIVELSTGLQAASSTATDTSGSPLALHTGIATSIAPTSGHVIPVTGSDGNIDSGFIGDFASTTTFEIGDTHILSIGKWLYASTTSGTSTFSVPSGIKKIKVWLIGAGGDGGSAAGTQAASGGGAGATCVKWYDVSATSTLQFHIASDDTDYSWFGGTYNSPVMKSTSGADGSTSGVGGLGGIATGCDLNINGVSGEKGSAIGSIYFGGNGASTIFGTGSLGTKSGTSNASNALGCGGGGGGGADTYSPGTGYTGCLYIEY